LRNVADKFRQGKNQLSQISKTQQGQLDQLRNFVDQLRKQNNKLSQAIEADEGGIALVQFKRQFT